MTLDAQDWLLSPHELPGFQKYEVIDHLQKAEIIHHTEHLFVRIPKRYALCNLTAQIKSVLIRSKVKDGFCFVSAMHITAGIYINDAEIGLLKDISSWLENLAPYGPDYQHHQTGEENGDAHLKSYLTNSSATVPVTQGKLDLGPWQEIFYAEFDGQREKRILIKVTGLY